MGTGASGRIEWLDIARGASIVLVVFFHVAITLEDYHLIHSLYIKLNKVFSPARMPLFFFVSGLLAMGIVQRGWRPLLVKKTLFFVYLYTLWLVIYWPVRTLVLDKEEPMLLLYVLRNFPNPGTWFWFIYALAIYFPLARLLTRIPSPVALLLAFLPCMAIMTQWIAFDNFIHNNLLKYFFFFMVGVRCKEVCMTTLMRWPLPGAILSGGMFLILFFLRVRFADAGIMHGVVEFLLACAAVTAGCSVAILCTRFGRLKHAVAYLGSNTLPIYLLHYFIITVSLKLLAPTLPNIPGIIYISAPVLLILATLLPLAIKRLTDKAGATWLFALPKKIEKHLLKS